MNPDDIQQAFDDITTRLDESDSSLQDYTDQLDNNLNDSQAEVDDHETRITELEANIGQLTFPLSQDTIDLIKEIYPTGFVTLVSGTATSLLDPRVSPTSNSLLTVSSMIGSPGFLAYTASAGQAIIYSTSGADNSIISYLLLN